MKTAVRVSLISLVSLGLFACGGARIANNREAAASAAFAASRGAGASQSNPIRMALDNVNAATSISSTTTASCPHGGSVAVAIDISSIDQSGNMSFDVTYSNCNYDGDTSLNGTVTMGLNWVVDGSASAAMALTMNGRVTFSGAISDFVEMNLTETVDATRLSDTSGTVSIVLDGTVTTSSGSYTYNHETVTITADGIEAAGQS